MAFFAALEACEGKTLLLEQLSDPFVFSSALFKKRGTEKGRIELKKIKVVEKVDESAFEKPYAFQVCFLVFNIYSRALNLRQRI